MFGRRKDKAKANVSLFTYYIDLKEDAIRDWEGSDAEIGCESEWKGKDEGVVRHIIDYLPKAEVHYHRTPGVFSESLAGVYRTHDGWDIEWGFQGVHFAVWLSLEETPLFYCPTDRAVQLLKTGHNETQNLRGESNLINIELSEVYQDAKCGKVMEETYSTFNLLYSNDLVKVVFETAPAHNVLYYDDYTDHK